MIETDHQVQNGTRPSWVVYLAPLAIMAIIFALSSRSHLPDLDGGSDFQNFVGHFTAYAALGATLTVVFRSLGWSPARALVAAVLVATLYGVTDEFHQSFVPGRNADPVDVMVDFLGATFGSILMLRLLDLRAAGGVPTSLDADPDQPAGESS